MNPIPDTRESLILKLRDPQERMAWEQFIDLYRPVVYRVARARGLQHADAQEVVQTVFVSVAGAIDRWQKRDASTRFRNWLMRIAKNATLNAISRVPPDQPGASSSVDALLNEIPEYESGTDALVELEYRRELFLQAARHVQSEVHPSTWKAFEMTAIDGMPLEAAARELGKSIGTIYASRSRVMKRLSAFVDNLEGSFE